MTGTQLAALIRRKTKTNSTTYSDANLLVDVNIMKDEIATAIAEAKNEAFNVVENDNLVADQRLYAYKTEVMNQIVRLSLKFSASGDFVLATKCNLKQTGIVTQESIIVNYYDNLNPEYFIRGKHIYILSGAIINVTDGIEWVYKIFPTDLANLTGSTDLSVDTSATALGFPKEFHEILARRVAIEYKDNNGTRLSTREMKYEKDLKDAISKFAIPTIDGEIIGSLPASDSDDGFDH